MTSILYRQCRLKAEKVGTTYGDRGRSHGFRVVAKPIDDARCRLSGGLVGILFPVPNGSDIDAEELRQVGLEDVQFEASPPYVLSDGSWL